MSSNMRLMLSLDTRFKQPSSVFKPVQQGYFGADSSEGILEKPKQQTGTGLHYLMSGLLSHSHSLSKDC